MLCHVTFGGFVESKKCLACHIQLYISHNILSWMTLASFIKLSSLPQHKACIYLLLLWLWLFFFSTTAIRTLLFSSICTCIVFQRVKFAEIVVFNVNVCPLRVTAYCCHILWCWSGSSCYGTYHHHYHHHHPPHRHYYHFHYHYQNYTWAVVNPVQRKTNTQACTLRTCLAFGIQ